MIVYLRWLQLLLIATTTGCGFFSNSYLFVGDGQVRGQALVLGSPARGALVFVLGEPENKVFADNDGYFSLITRAGEDKNLVVLWGSSHGVVKPFDLAGEADQRLGKIELDPTGLVEGTVLMDNPSDADVEVLGTPLGVRPLLHGKYRLSLPPGTWRLNVGAVGYGTTPAADIRSSALGLAQVDPISLEKDPNYTCQGNESRQDHYIQGGGGAVDILLVIDNSGSMAGKQQVLARSFRSIAHSLADAGVDFHIAVITPGLESSGCPACVTGFESSCINETGENGRFQDRLGRMTGTIEDPQFDFITDPSCRVVTPENISCLYDDTSGRGITIVGTNGCGYERGLAAMRASLGGELLSSYNSGFLRPEARLAVIMVSDEGDCGEVGDVYDGIQATPYICYFAEKGVDPDGNTQDEIGRPYKLTPVEDYYQFLVDLKNSSVGMVTFASIVGVRDPLTPETTTIEYDSSNPDLVKVVPVCRMSDCIGNYCYVYPGIRYIKLAQIFGGTIDSICQQNFTDTILRVAGLSTGVRRHFVLRRAPISADGIQVQVELEPVSGNAWVYHEQTKTVEFNEDYVPHPYAAVEFGYQTTCP